MDAAKRRDSESSSAVERQQRPIDTELVDCLMCGSDDFGTVLIMSDPITRRGGMFRVVQCRECGLAFTNPRPTHASIGAFYQEDYPPHCGDALDKCRPWRRQLERSVLRRFRGYPPQPVGVGTTLMSLLGLATIRRRLQRQSWIPFCEPGRLLDFGCGAGQFLEDMRRYGWQVQGIDISPTVAHLVHQRTGIPVHVGSLPHADVKPESLDAITMWNSLEHVHQPRKVIGSAYEALRPGGVIVLGVPNIDSWSFRQFQHDWFALDLPRHLVHFSPDSLSHLLDCEGFRVLRVDHIARSGWIQRSVRLAAARRPLSWRLRLCGNSRWARLVALRNERMRTADYMNIIARKA